MLGMSWFDPELFATLRAERELSWGHDVHLFDEVSSTNDEALTAVSSGAGEGGLWVAREQSQGRGRRGNTWVAPPEECLMLSTVLRYQGDPERLMGLSLVVGLSVKAAVQARLDRCALGVTAQIKWPNDVLVEGKKLAGILVETRSAPEGDLGIVIGVGLNVHTTEFPSDIGEATSLAKLGVGEADLGFEALTADFLLALQEKSRAFFGQDFSPFLPELVHADYLHERRIRVGKVEGRGSGFDTAGRLLVADAGGKLTPVISGHVELLED
jgi:BirA family biotin operon repressor/biotin-[acetyl-CoA-carboxylase] ligase